MANPKILIEMENGDVMKAELYPEIAPITVQNFLELVGKGFYDGTIFHRCSQFLGVASWPCGQRALRGQQGPLNCSATLTVL